MNQKDNREKSQRTHFIETARELECNEDEAAFDTTMDWMALKKDAPRESLLDRKPKSR